MSVTPFGLKIGTWVTAANGDTYGDADRFFLRTIQALVQPNVLQVGLNTPPGSPTNSQTYVVGTAPTGAWSAQANAVAYWAVDAQDGSDIRTHHRNRWMAVLRPSGRLDGLRCHYPRILALQSYEFGVDSPRTSSISYHCHWRYSNSQPSNWK